MPAGLNVDAIVSDNYASTLEAMRRLTARGHRRIARLTDLRPSVFDTGTFAWVSRRAPRIGETEPSRWTRFFTTFSVARDLYYPQLVREVHDAILALMHSPEPPTALFCLQDAYMAGALKPAPDWELPCPTSWKSWLSTTAHRNFCRSPRPCFALCSNRTKWASWPENASLQLYKAPIYRTPTRASKSPMCPPPFTIRSPLLEAQIHLYRVLI